MQIYYVPELDQDEDFYFPDGELFNDLPEAASGSNAYYNITVQAATQSDAVSLSVIHEDIQLLNYTILFIFILCFVLYLGRRSR